MNLRTLRGFSLSEIGVGCYALSGAYGQKDPQAYRQMLEQAVDCGVIFFDTADTYGDLAEALLGEVLRPVRDRVMLATKIGMRGGQRPDLSRAAVLAACEASLRRLQTDWIDLYQVHYDDPATPVEETLAALDELVLAGKIRAYGIGHLPMPRIQDYLENGNVLTGQFELSAVARDTRAEVLPLLRAHDAGLIAFSVTGRGLLTGRFHGKPTFAPGDIRNLDPLFQWERYDSGVRTAAKLADLGRLYGKSSAQVAIAWVLAQPGLLCALTGPSSVAHLQENLGGSGWQIDSAHLAELEHFFDMEDQLLREAQAKRVQHILSSPLTNTPEAAVQALIYVIETAITSGWVAQEAIMPVFLSVFQVQKQPTEGWQEQLEKARRELQGILAAHPSASSLS